MSKTLRISLFFVLFFVGFFSVIAQTKKQPLTNVLSNIENDYQVSFSYADQDVVAVFVEISLENKTLEVVLEEISYQTNLQFNKIDNQYYSIVKTTESSGFSLQQLEEIIVTNYLTSGIYKNNTGSISIKTEQFGILPGLIDADVLQTIQALPGVLSVDETVSNINVRGGTHDQNLLLYDGIKMYQSGHFFGLISAFNPHLTETVSVIKNGTSAKYGDGVSSVVDMQLSDKISAKHQIGIGLNLISADGYVKFPLGQKTEIQVAARRSVTDVLDTPTYSQYFKRVFQDSDLTNTEDAAISKNETFYFYDTALKFLYDVSEKDKIRFNFLNIHNNLLYNEEATINTTSEASESQLKQQNLASGLSYERQWNTKLNTFAQVYYSNYNLDATNYDILNNQRLIQENNVIDGGVKLYANYSLTNHLNINGGLQLSEVGISNLEDVNNPVFRSYIKRVIRTYSGFAEAQFQSKNKNTLIRLGVRDNYFEKFKLHLIEPRLHINQRFLNHFRAELSAEFKSQSTTQIIDLQKDFLGIEKRRWVLSNNTTIPILKSKQASFGLAYNKNQLLLSAEAYVKQVDGITTRTQGFQNQYQFVNAIGSYQIKGIDVLINKQFKNFGTWLSYSYSENNCTFDNLNAGQSFPNNFDITHVIDFAGTYTLNNLKLALGANWHSGRPFTEPNYEDSNNNTIIYQSPNSSRLNDYLRADFSATYEFNIGKNQAILGASIWNILNQKNTINTYFTIENNELSKVENQSLGLTPNVSFKVRF